MIIIEYKEIYLATDFSLYIYCLLSCLIAPSNEHSEHCLIVLLCQAMSTLSTAVIFRSCRALIAVCFLVCRVVAVVPTIIIYLSDRIAIRINPYYPKEIFKYLSIRTDMLKYIDNFTIKGYFAAAFSPGGAKLRTRFIIGPRYK